MMKWFRKKYNIVINSIAFYPALIAIGFLLFSWAMLELDFSQTGKMIKADYSWIRLKDASTARSIVSTIAGGIISLTVFSFSMVMILLNQAASQMSNRVLESMINNRFQQIILGFYIGSIVYALFLLSTIRDIDSGVYVPALSIYFLLVLTILDIFLFIYFLHYVTQSVKFETIINRVQKKTSKNLEESCFRTEEKSIAITNEPQYLNVLQSDYFQDFDKKALIDFAVEHKGTVKFLMPAGTYLLKGNPLAIFYGDMILTEKEIGAMMDTIDFYNGQPIYKNAYYGFHQLAEVALKALSPGINDPETAVLSIHSLCDLFLFKMQNTIKTIFDDKYGRPRIETCEWNFEQLFRECFQPIWDYGKKDFYIQNALRSMLQQLSYNDTTETHKKLFESFLKIIDDQSKQDNII